jgi:hypothetical protein
MLLRKLRSVGLQLLLLAVMAAGTVASASPLAGQLNIAGTGSVSLTGVDFIPPVGGGTGQIVVLPGANTGDFAFLNSPPIVLGSIQDRDESTQPVGQLINIPNWLNASTFSFTLRFIQVGTFSPLGCFAAPADAQTCTPPAFDPDGAGPQPAIPSPYNLTNFEDTDGDIGSTASFTVNGTVVNTANGDTALFAGVFNATFQKIPYQTLLAQVLSGGSVNAPFTAQFTVRDIPQVPEPSSMAMALGGLVLVGAGMVRRRHLS